VSCGAGEMIRRMIRDANRASAVIKRLHEAFYSTKPTGMGMGLSICRAIIEAHGGKLWATQGAPHGAVFQFALPSASAALAAARA
jgi:signal transduction histidine kinase